MKKEWFLYVAVGILATFGVASCERDGVYQPAKKISKIYIQEGNGDKQLYAEWKWKGNKLEQIAYPLNRDTAHFSYEKGKMSKISYTGVLPRYFSFQYDANLLSKMNLYEENTLLVSYQFFHDKKKINKVIVLEFAPNKSGLQHLGDLFSLLSLPDIAAESVEMAALEYGYKGSGGNGGGGGETTVKASYSFTFIWDEKKNNIVQTTTQPDLSLPSSSLTTTMKYMYDNKNNPFKGLQSEVTDEATMGHVYDVASGSKNNIIKAQLVVGKDANAREHSIIKTDYVYNKKYPVMATSKQTFTDIPHFEKVTTRWYEYK